MLEFKELDAIKTKDGREGIILDCSIWQGIQYLLIEPKNAEGIEDCFNVTPDEVAEVIYRFQEY